MPLRADRFGLSVALATPFAEDRSIDLPRLVAHGLQSLADGCNSLTVFGTTGEGASLGLNERNRALGALVATEWFCRKYVDAVPVGAEGVRS